MYTRSQTGDGRLGNFKCKVYSEFLRQSEWFIGLYGRGEWIQLVEDVRAAVGEAGGTTNMRSANNEQNGGYAQLRILSRAPKSGTDVQDPGPQPQSAVPIAVQDPVLVPQSTASATADVPGSISNSGNSESLSTVPNVLPGGHDSSTAKLASRSDSAWPATAAKQSSPARRESAASLGWVSVGDGSVLRASSLEDLDELELEAVYITKQLSENVELTYCLHSSTVIGANQAAGSCGEF